MIYFAFCFGVIVGAVLALELLAFSMWYYGHHNDYERRR